MFVRCVQLRHGLCERLTALGLSKHVLQQLCVYALNRQRVPMEAECLPNDMSKHH